MAKPTLPIIIGNRDFFPGRLVTEARRDLRALFQRLDVERVILEMPPHRRRFWWTLNEYLGWSVSHHQGSTGLKVRLHWGVAPIGAHGFFGTGSPRRDASQSTVPSGSCSLWLLFLFLMAPVPYVVTR